MDENLDIYTPDEACEPADSEERYEELIELFRKRSESRPHSSESIIKSRGERLRDRSINILAAVVSITVATLVTVGIPVLVTTLIVKATKKEK